MSSKPFLPLLFLSVLLVVVVSAVMWSPIFLKTPTAYQQSLPVEDVVLEIKEEYEGSNIGTFTQEGDDFIYNHLLIPVAKARGIYFENEQSTCAHEKDFMYKVFQNLSTSDTYVGGAVIYPYCHQGVALKFIVHKKDLSIKVAEINPFEMLYLEEYELEDIVVNLSLEEYLASQHNKIQESEDVEAVPGIGSVMDLSGSEHSLTFNRKGDSIMAQELINPLLQKLGIQDNSREMFARCPSGVFYGLDEKDLHINAYDQHDEHYFHGIVTVNQGCGFYGLISFRLSKDGKILEVFDKTEYMNAKKWVDAKTTTWFEERKKVLGESF